MDKKAASGILVGRPFGGVSIMCRKNLSSCIQILECDDSEGRFISLKLCNKLGKDIIITCVYFPCISLLRDYVTTSSVIIAHIENILTVYENDNHVIAGDFNFECVNGNIGYDLFKYIIIDYNLMCCDNKVYGLINYTYCHETLNHKSWIDQIFISNSLYNSSVDCDIIDCGENLSDHLPIRCTLKLDYVMANPTEAAVKRPYKERWDKS